MKNSIISTCYLLFLIIKDQWLSIVALAILSISFYLIPILLFQASGGYKVGMGMVANFALLPSILTALVLLPIYNQQISTSFISRRLKIVNVDERIYNAIVLIFFALIALLMFYIMMFISFILYDRAFELTMENKEQYIFYYVEPAFFLLIFLAPLLMVGLTSIGFLISKIRINEIIKGIIIFFIIIWLLTMSRGVISFYDYLDIGEDGSYENIDVLKKVDTIHMLLNPMGSIIFTLQYSFVGDLITTSSVLEFEGVTDNGVYFLDEYVQIFKALPTILYAIVSSISFAAGAILPRWK